MEARNLLPDFFHLVDITGDEPEELGHIFCFSPLGHTADGRSVGGACSTLLSVLLTCGQYGLDVNTPIEITRYVERSGTFARVNSLTIAISEGENFTLAQIFGSPANAQELVAEAWQRIHLSTDEAVLTRPINALSLSLTV